MAVVDGAYIDHQHMLHMYKGVQKQHFNVEECIHM